MPESPHNFIKQHAIRDWVVKWSFGPPKPEKTAIGTTDGYRYNIVKHAAGPQEAVRLWRERTLPKYAPVTDREPIVHKVYIYTDRIGTIGEARRVIEAEDPKRFLRSQPRTSWVAKSFGGGMLWFECAARPLLAFILHWNDGPHYTIEYKRMDQSRYSEKETFTLPTPDTNAATAKAKQMAASFFWRKGWLGAAGDAPAPVREAENAKSILRQAMASRAKMIHCFKDFHFLRSVPRPAPPAMLTALHALQSEECEMDAHVFTVLDLQAGYAFHQSARCIDPTHFRTERLWKSACGRALVAKIR